jgi:hypothetical protein
MGHRYRGGRSVVLGGHGGGGLVPVLPPLGRHLAAVRRLLRAAVAQHAGGQQQGPGQHHELADVDAVRLAEAGGRCQHRSDAAQPPVRVQLPACKS